MRVDIKDKITGLIVWFFVILFLVVSMESGVGAKDQWINFTTEDGLGSDHVYSIAIDGAGVKWFGLGEGFGVTRYDGETWHGLEDLRVV